MKSLQGQFLIGVDVGTGSARAGVFDLRGRLHGSASHPIQLWRPQPDFVEQSSEDIWWAVCAAVKAAVKVAGVSAQQIVGVGFDGTCSLVVLDSDDRPVSVSPSGRVEQNIIVWMDHRAIRQAERINQTGHRMLRYVGGVISPEMQMPKLLWLKETMPSTWRRAARFFDLPDYLTYRATGDDTRSLCTTVCKWNYDGQRGLDGAGWNQDFFSRIGLEDFVSEGFQRIGKRVRPMGSSIDGGLTPRVAQELGLRTGTAVGVASIDAHAGGLGLLGAPLGRSRRLTPAMLNRRLALIGGTSSCHMAVSQRPRFIPGIWGPYSSAMLPGFWLSEGGQSATGALIDHVIYSHAAAALLQTRAKSEGKTVYELLNLHLKSMAKTEGVVHPAELTTDLHVQPDFLGNRSPYADPTLRGSVVGLKLPASLDDLARQYLATIQAVAYGTRHIIEHMNSRGYEIDTILACGGGTKNDVFVREHADITGCRMVLPREPEAVLLGSALLGGVAAGMFKGIAEAMAAMNSAGDIITPVRGRVSRFHEAKYRVFLRLHRDFLAYRLLMTAAR